MNEIGSRPGERWRLRNWRLWTKLMAVLAVPLLLAGVLGAARVVTSVQDAVALDSLVDRFTAGQQVTHLVDALARERVAAVTFVASDRAGSRADLDAATRAVDAAAPVVTTGEQDRYGAGLADVVAAAHVRLDDLAALRRAVTGTAFPVERVEAAYTSVLDAVRALERGVLSPADPTLVRSAADALLLDDAREQIQREHAVLGAVLVRGTATPALADAARQVDAQLAGTLAGLSASALAATRERVAQTVAGAAVDGRERIAQQTLVALTLGRPVPPVAADWNTASTQTADLVGRVQAAAQQDLVDAATALAATTRAAAVRLGVLVAALIALAMLLLAVVARSLLRPLRALRAAALDIAERRLPERTEQMTVIGGRAPSTDVTPIGVRTGDEIGEVARAFDAVHAAAVRLAAQQALLRHHVDDIFVNLSRRSQSLVGRQLELIGRLARREHDPDHLDELFRLDHLATRMRRNNENLLVLAGGSPQRGGRVGPASAQEVLEAAVSEVELYQQVTVGAAPDVEVGGAAVADLVHLVAELLDNATLFCPPGAPVELDAAVEPDGGMVVEVRDSGVGIEPGELAQLNAQLEKPPLIDAAVSRRMGLFVVGRLAQRHGITVTLHRATGGAGVLARVVLPPRLVRSAPVEAVPAGARRHAAHRT